MDLKALQTTLRQFAAERDWQPFHTPKNLAMALTVEAAELAEIFQWMTPEQSRAAHGDVVLQAQIADELADVLLYLVQIADHTGVDLKRAVGRKLVKNAKKHPPLRPGMPAGPGAGVPAETHVLVDWENVQPGDDDIRALVPDVTDLWLFHGPGQKRVGAGHASFGERATTVKIARTGKNALDFHLSFYMGYIASRHPNARFVVVSNDKGYAPMIEHAAELGFSARQVGFGGAAATRPRAAGRSTAKAGSAGKTAPAARTAPAKKAPARKASTARGGTRDEAAAATVAPAPPNARAASKQVQAKPVPAKQESVKPAAARQATTAPAPAKKAATRAAKPASPRAAAARSVDHVVASLAKTANKPPRRAGLVATIRSLLGPSAGDAAVEAMLKRLLDAGKVALDARGGVRYAL